MGGGAVSGVGAGRGSDRPAQREGERGAADPRERLQLKPAQLPCSLEFISPPPAGSSVDHPEAAVPPLPAWVPASGPERWG